MANTQIAVVGATAVADRELRAGAHRLEHLLVLLPERLHRRLLAQLGAALPHHAAHRVPGVADEHVAVGQVAVGLDGVVATQAAARERAEPWRASGDGL